jgi:hypothetical protein
MQLIEKPETAIAEAVKAEEEIMSKPETSAVGVDHIWYDCLGD